MCIDLSLLWTWCIFETPVSRNLIIQGQTFDYRTHTLFLSAKHHTLFYTIITYNQSDTPNSSLVLSIKAKVRWIVSDPMRLKSNKFTIWSIKFLHRFCKITSFPWFSTNFSQASGIWQSAIKLQQNINQSEITSIYDGNCFRTSKQS